MFPYGEKDDAFLLQRFKPLFDEVLRYAQADLVVVACNTASTLFLQQLRQNYPQTPFIGVVPAIKPAAELTQTGVIALLATPATIQRQYVDLLKQSHAKNCELIRFSHPDLARLAELKMRGEVLVQAQFTELMQTMRMHPQAANIDVIILGCTHFPAIVDELTNAWPYPVTWLDSGEAIARRAEQLCLSIPAQPTTLGTLILTSETQRDILQTIFQRFAIHKSTVLSI